MFQVAPSPPAASATPAQELADLPLFDHRPPPAAPWRSWALILDGLLDPFRESTLAVRWSVESNAIGCQLLTQQIYDSPDRARIDGHQWAESFRSLLDIHAPELTLYAPPANRRSPAPPKPEDKKSVRWLARLPEALAGPPEPLGLLESPPPPRSPNLRSVVTCLQAMGEGTQLQMTLRAGLHHSPANDPIGSMEPPSPLDILFGEIPTTIFDGSPPCADEPRAPEPLVTGASLDVHLFGPQRPPEALLRALRTSLGARPGTPQPTDWELWGEAAHDAAQQVAHLNVPTIGLAGPISEALSLMTVARRVAWPRAPLGCLEPGSRWTASP